MSIDDAELARIEAALRDDGVYVDPTMRSVVPATVERRLEQVVSTSPVPIKVVVVPVDYDDPNYQGRFELLAGTVRSDLGPGAVGDGVYVGTEGDASTGTVSAASFGDVGGDDYFYALSGARAQEPDDVTAQLALTVRLLADGRGREVYEKYAGRPGQDTAGSGGAGDGDHTALGFVVLAVIGVALLALGRWLGRRPRGRRASGPRSSTPRPRPTAPVTDRPFSLPDTVLGSIRESQDRKQRRTAEAEVLALGERIDATELRPGSDRDAWQAALDHYDLARRILDRTRSQADVVGALVLARRGEEALGAADRGRRWSPTPSCYFNPLHGRGERRARWEGESGAVEVPACRACATSVASGGEPLDVLDFVVTGRPVHYFETDAEPWASTGYGSLETDLVTRLFTDPRAR